MPNFETQDIRNVALIGHAGCGKTTLAEAMLYEAKAINRRGWPQRHGFGTHHGFHS